MTTAVDSIACSSIPHVSRPVLRHCLPFYFLTLNRALFFNLVRGMAAPSYWRRRGWESSVFPGIFVFPIGLFDLVFQSSTKIDFVTLGETI